MIIGVPRETKDNEYRVGMVPAGVRALREKGHEVLVEAGAGTGSGIPDDDYVSAGAEMLQGPEAVYGRSDLIVKVKEPQPREFGLLRPDTALFTYLHLASVPEVTAALLERRIIGIGYETVQTDDGRLPLLQPMSEVAGRMAVQVGARFLERPEGGRGVLLGGVPGVTAGRVTVLGAGTVGVNAARTALGLGARVTVILRNKARMVYLDDVFEGRLQCLASNSFNIEAAVLDSDLLVGAVLVPGRRAPVLVTEEMVRRMRRGSVIVDVAVDQGGCVETTRPTSHSRPTYEAHGVIHYGVTNMPGAVPRTSTFALTNETLPYVLRLADLGVAGAVAGDRSLARGVNTRRGGITCEPVADSLGLPFTPLERLL